MYTNKVTEQVSSYQHAMGCPFGSHVMMLHCVCMMAEVMLASLVTNRQKF